MAVVPAGLATPTTGTERRAPLSARRTSHIDMIFGRGSHEDPLRLRGFARDLYTAENGSAEIVAEAGVEAGLGESKVLRSLSTSPDEPAAERLLGLEVGRGFRAALQNLEWSSTTADDPLHLLLDDLPVAALISGYATLYDAEPSGEADGQAGASRPGEDRGGTAARMVKEDICSGWRHDGTMMVALRKGDGLPIPVGPPAPCIESEDPIGWHSIEELSAGSMRRRRLIDVAAGEMLTVHSMFRDTHRGPDGIERVLHEYTVTASVDPTSLIVVDCEAQPRSLPWIECPAAADSASRLEGVALGNLRSFVQAELRGVPTCTHLNDLLRSLGDVAALAGILAARRR